MGVDTSVFVAIVLCILVLIIALGIVCYLVKNVCGRRFKKANRVDSGSPQRETLMASIVKTTTDDPDKSGMKLHTIEQILKEEEKGSISQSLKQVDLPNKHHKQPELVQLNAPPQPPPPSPPPSTITTATTATTTPSTHSKGNHNHS